MQFLMTNAWDNRAMRAYFTRGRRDLGRDPDQPTSPSTYVDDRGRAYVVLHNRHGILAIYAVSNDDRLRLVAADGWPKELVDLYA